MPTVCSARSRPGAAFHIPNGEQREPSTAARLTRMGVKPGVPDVFLPVPMGIFHGLWSKLKRMGGTATVIQEAGHGHCANRALPSS